MSICIHMYSYICLTRSAYKICAGVISVRLRWCNYESRKSGKRFQCATRKRNFCIDRGWKVTLPSRVDTDKSLRFHHPASCGTTLCRSHWDKRFIVRIAIHTMRAHAKRKKLRGVVFCTRARDVATISSNWSIVMID